MKCLVIGASGYLGSHLVHALQAACHEVGAVSRSGQTGLTADVCDPSSLLVLDWDVDNVFLMAGVTGTTASFSQYQSFVSGNQMI